MSSFPLADQDVIAVSEAWVQANQADYLWPKLPRCKVLSEHDGGSGIVTYKLNAIPTALLDGTGLINQPMNRPAPAPRKITEEAATLTYAPKGAPQSIDRPLKARAHRNKAFEQVVEMQMAEVNQGIDNDVIARLKDTNFFTTQTWSAVLDTGNADPIRELVNKILPGLKYRTGKRWKLIGVIDQRVLLVMRALVDFHGGGTGSATLAFADEATVVGFLRTALRLDELHVVQGATNDAVLGQTPSITDIGDGLFWIGLVDTMAGQDMATYPADGPDGGLVLAFGHEPYVTNHVPDGTQVERFHGKAEYGVNTPRTTNGPWSGKWGFFFPTAQNLT